MAGGSNAGRDSSEEWWSGDEQESGLTQGDRVRGEAKIMTRLAGLWVGWVGETSISSGSVQHNQKQEMNMNHHNMYLGHLTPT